MHWGRWRRACPSAVIVFAAIAAAANHGLADALVVTKAMTASTIAEVFIEEERVRVEIEVGAADVAAFANILPDELHEKVTGQTRPLEERLQAFLETDWGVQAGGQPLRGRLERIVAAKRVARDEVTGEALAVQPADAEFVIRLTLRYPLEDHPQSLTFGPPRTADSVTANIGFVCYHDGLPVNDFRYLSGEVTLDLDWDDPWYSRFRHPNLRRQFDAPLSAYLYIEPYEVRKEIIVRPKDMQSWLDLELRGDGVIRVEQQEELKRRVAKFLSEKNPVSIDGRPATGRLDRIHFIRRTLRATGIIEPAVDLDATSATLGVIFVYPVDKLPEEVSMEWQLFTPKIQAIPTVASDEAGGLPSKVTPTDPQLTWRNYLTNPTSPQMLMVARPPSKRQLAVPMLSVLCGSVVFGSFVILFKQRAAGGALSRITLATSLAAIAVGVISLPFARITIANPFDKPPILSPQEYNEILTRLLYNVYRSFDHHDESLIYDRLAKSISGELLSDVYLETRESMEVKNQGGLRISVKEVNVTELDAIDSNEAEPTFRCQWQVSGWIGHWGHIHARVNEHVALITLAERDGMWKITAMEMLDERSVEPSPTPLSRQQATGT